MKRKREDDKREQDLIQNTKEEERTKFIEEFLSKNNIVNAKAWVRKKFVSKFNLSIR